MKKVLLSGLFALLAAVSFADGATSSSTLALNVNVAPYVFVQFDDASLTLNLTNGGATTAPNSLYLVKSNCPIVATAVITTVPSGVDSHGIALPALPADFFHLYGDGGVNFDGGNEIVYSQGGTGEVGARGYLNLQHAPVTLDIAAGSYTGGVITVTVTGNPA